VLQAYSGRTPSSFEETQHAAVPWARHRSRFTVEFEDQVGWLAVHCSKTAVAELMRTSWPTIGGILERVAAEATAKVDLLAGLRRIGIDRSD
jgi:transposase